MNKLKLYSTALALIVAPFLWLAGDSLKEILRTYKVIIEGMIRL